MSADAPPSYQQATGRLTNSTGPRPANGIPIERRRSMEDENRPLPKGWVRSYDSKNNHQFFVDTTADPPRSIWHHPHDDDQYLSTLSSEQREHIEELNRHPTRPDIVSMSSSESLHQPSKNEKAGAGAQSHGEVPDHKQYTHTSGYHAGPSNAPPPKGLKKFGRSLKDKLTGSTHEEREQERRQRDIEEQQEYETHVRIRQAMARAAETGQPQLIGKDKNGREVYVEPPNYGGYGGGFGGGYGGGYGGGGYGYSPYNNGPYVGSNNAGYIRPQYPYSRPVGYGYGGGYGLPLAGGLLGGALLGGLLF